MEKVLSNISIALNSVRVNRMRSALSILGITIGVGAVIAMIAVGSGATARIQDQIRSIGSNLILIVPGSLTTSGIRLGSGANVTLTEDDARAIKAECPAVATVAPVVRGSAQVTAESNNWATTIQGTTPDYFTVRDLSAATGRPLNSQDVESAARVAVVGQTVTKNLFGAVPAVTEVIRIKNVPFTVVGVLTPKGQSPSGQDQDDVILIPISTAKRDVLGVSHANAHSVGSLLVQAADSQLIKQAQDEIEPLLRQRHRLEQNQENDFAIQNLSEIFAAQEGSAQVMSLLLGAIASVSLLVGGIGIMNIMLVSVTERTREIGLRRAIGARTTDILSQFLVEAITLSALGGAAGIAIGVAASLLISYFAHWSTLVGGPSIVLAFAFSTLVGVGFGYYPARKAAMLNPIDALRYE